MTKTVICEDNPLGIIAIDHLEFTCDSLDTPTKELFYTFGFSKTSECQLKQEELFSQGQVRFLLNLLGFLLDRLLYQYRNHKM